MNTPKPKFKPAVVQINPVLEESTPLPFTPKQATNQAVGFDVKPRFVKVVGPNVVHCQIGFKVKPPKGFKLVLVPNSRLTKYNWVMQNSPGQIDPDFRGEVEIRFRAIPTGISIKQVLLNLLRKKAKHKNPLTYDPFPFTTNDVCGQIFIEKVYNTEFHLVPESELGETDRGEGGFGSTANK